MNRIVIIEDEPIAADHLEMLIQRLDPQYTVVAKLPSVKQALAWFGELRPHDLVLSDIQLGDGTCFNIFEQIPPSAPVIFTTAFDQYALQAFKANGVDYLLKPINPEALADAFTKLKRLKEQSQAAMPFTAEEISRLRNTIKPNYKQRFVVTIGDHTRLVPTADIVYFLSEHKLTYLMTQSGHKLPVAHTLQQLEDLVDPALFFRINRQYLIRDAAIEKVTTITNSRLKVQIPFSKTPVVVSRDRCQAFRQWMSGA